MGVDHSKYQNAVETPVIEKKEVPVVSEKAPESKPFGHPKTGTPGVRILNYIIEMSPRIR